MVSKTQKKQQMSLRPHNKFPPAPPPPPCPTCQAGISFSKKGDELSKALAMAMMTSYDPECTMTPLRAPTSFKCQQAWAASGLSIPAF